MWIIRFLKGIILAAIALLGLYVTHEFGGHIPIQIIFGIPTHIWIENNGWLNRIHTTDVTVPQVFERLGMVKTFIFVVSGLLAQTLLIAIINKVWQPSRLKKALLVLTLPIMGLSDLGALYWLISPS